MTCPKPLTEARPITEAGLCAIEIYDAVEDDVADMDVLGAQLTGEGLRDRTLRGLGGGDRDRAGAAAQGGAGTDDDDVAVSGGACRAKRPGRHGRGRGHGG